MQGVSELEAATALEELREIGEYVQYARRVVPEFFGGHSSPPPAWTGDAASWGKLLNAARLLPGLQAASDLVYAVEKGFRPSEAPTETLLPSSQAIQTSRPVQAPRSKISSELERHARQGLHELRARRLTLDATLMVALEQADAGSYTSEPAQLIGAVKAATAASNAYDRERQQAAETKAALTKVTVLAVAGPSRKYTPGDYKLTAEEVTELQEWAAKVESQAAGRSLSSLGYKVWPAFIVEAT